MYGDAKIEVSREDNGKWESMSLDQGLVFALGGGALRISDGDFMMVLRKPTAGTIQDGFKPVVSELGPIRTS